MPTVGSEESRHMRYLRCRFGVRFPVTGKVTEKMH